MSKKLLDCKNRTNKLDADKSISKTKLINS